MIKPSEVEMGEGRSVGWLRVVSALCEHLKRQIKKCRQWGWVELCVLIGTPPMHTAKAYAHHSSPPWLGMMLPCTHGMLNEYGACENMQTCYGTGICLLMCECGIVYIS